MRSLSKSIAWLCLLLTLGSAVAFAAHHHSSADEATKCTICIAAHSASPKATSNIARAGFVLASTFRPKPVSAKQQLLTFALSVRPPPAV